MKERTNEIFCPRKGHLIPLWKCPNRIKAKTIEGGIQLTVITNCENCKF